MTKIFAIAKNSLIQTIRQPFFSLTILLTIVMLIVSVPLSTWSVGTGFEKADQDMLQLMGLSSIMFMVIFVAILSASSTVSKEINDKTALTVLTKPISRFNFILGKFVGVTAAVSIAFYILTLVFFMTVRHKVVSTAVTPIDWPVITFGASAIVLAFIIAGLGNFIFSWSFNAAMVISLLTCLTGGMIAITFIGNGWKLVPFTHTFEPDNISIPLLKGLLMIYFAVILVSAISIAISTRLSKVLTLVFTFMIFFAGSMYDWIQKAVLNEFALGDKIMWLFPNLPFFFPLDTLEKSGEIPVGLITVYFLFYLAGVICLSLCLFENREIAGKETSSAAPGPIMLISGIGRIIAAVIAVFAIGLFLKDQTYQQWWGFVKPAGMIIACIAGWILFKQFANGWKPAYFIVALFSLAGLLFSGLSLMTFIFQSTFLLDILGSAFMSQIPYAILTCVVSCSVVATLMMQKTRIHFRLGKFAKIEMD